MTARALRAADPTRGRAVVVSLVLIVASMGCGDGAELADTTPATAAPVTSGQAETQSTTTEVQTQTSSTIDQPAALAATGSGLGVVSFGDEAESAIGLLIDQLGGPDLDTGWIDPSDPNEPLWPGCPGKTARLLQWTDNLSAVFSDWAGDVASPGASVDTPYFAGYGLWTNSPIRTADGATTAMTLAEIQAIYGQRVFVSDQPDEAIELYWMAIDGTANPLSRTGGLRSWLIPPEDRADDVPGPGPNWAVVNLVAGLSCDTP